MATYPNIKGVFTTGDTVTITIYKDSDESVEVNAASCNEMGSTGVFYYTPSIIQATDESYTWVMTNGITSQDYTGSLDPISLSEVNTKTGFSLSVSGINAIWDQLLTAISTTGSIGKLIKDYLDVAVSTRLASSSYTTPPTVAQIDTQLTSTHGSGSWQRDSGAGSTLKQYTQYYGGVPLADCEIWATTDLAGTNIVASDVTDASGIANLYPDVAVGTTLYIWKRKVGYTFTNPDVEVA